MNNRLFDPKQIILADKYDSCNRDGGYFDIDTIEEMMREYGAIIRDKTLEWAAENAKLVEGVDGVDVNYCGQYIKVDEWTEIILCQESILNGKTSKALEI